jgi:hypothetical protein
VLLRYSNGEVIRTLANTTDCQVCGAAPGESCFDVRRDGSKSEMGPKGIHGFGGRFRHVGERSWIEKLWWGNA